MKTKKNWMENVDLNEFAEMLKAISHPSRLEAMFLLCTAKENKMTVKDLYRKLKISQPVMSRHLGILKNSGLLERVVEGGDTYYELKTSNQNVKHLLKCFTH